MYLAEWCGGPQCTARLRNTGTSSQKCHHSEHKEIRPRDAGMWKDNCSYIISMRVKAEHLT